MKHGALAVAGSLAVLGVASRLRQALRKAPQAGRQSGISAAELGRALPGDDLVPAARVVFDRATSLPAPPERVWPWLVQLGKGRAGWYLPAWLETAVPRERRGLRRLDPGLQDLGAGDEVPDWGPGDPVFRVVTVEPPRALVYLSVRDRANDHRWPDGGPPYSASAMVLSWALVLSDERRPDGGAGSRLHLRLRINRLGKRAPGVIAALAGLMDDASVRPMFAGLAERVRP